MFIFLLPIGAGAVLGKIRGVRLSDAAGLSLRAPWLVFVALALQVAVPKFRASGRVPVVVFSYAVVGVWLVLNLMRRPLAVRLACGLLALGWGLNVLAIAPNGGMPVSRAALAAVGAPATLDIREGDIREGDVEQGNLSKHVAAESTSVLRWLGDTIPVPPLYTVISIGDIALAVGIVLLLSSAATGQPPAAPTSVRHSDKPARTSAGFMRSVASGIWSTMARCSQ